MASRVALSNLAASKVGTDDQIRDPNEDSHVARSIAAVWDIVRQAALRDHDWNFASARQSLGQLDETPVYGFTTVFQLPSDCLRLREILNLNDPTSYRVEGRTVLCNQAGPLYVRYTQDVQETEAWDHLFAEVFACRLALQIGPRLAGSAYDKAAGDYALRAALNAAKRADAVENPRIAQDEPDDWELARHGSGRPPADWAYWSRT